MESGDYKRKHRRRDDEDHRKSTDRKRHHRHKDREGKVEGSLNSEKRNRNVEEHHRRKRHGDESNHHKHKSKEERKERDDERIYFKERKEHKQKHCKESKEKVSVPQKSVEGYSAKMNVCNNTKSTRSIDTICNKCSKHPTLCKYKTFHLGQKEHVPREETSKPRKHRARSERQSKEKNKVSQIWYCQIDTTGPFKQIRKSEERPETVPKKYDKISQKLRIKQRPKSTPEKNANGEFYHSSSRSQLIKAKRHSSKRSKAEKEAVNKQDISKKIEDDYTKKIENNLKTYFGKIEKLIDKKLDDYLHLKNTKLRETIEDNVKFIERERNKHQHGRDRDKRLKKRKNSLRSISSHEEMIEALTKAQKRSKSKVLERSHHPAPNIFPTEAKYEDDRHPDVYHLNRTPKRESRHYTMAQELFKEKRNERSLSTKREAMFHEKKYDENAYKELNFEKGYLRGDIRTNEDKRKKVKKSKIKTQTTEELIASNKEPTLTVVPKEEHGVATRNAKIQHNYPPLTDAYPPKQITNKLIEQNPSTSVVYFKPSFSSKNIPSFSVYERNSSSFELFARQTNENQVDFVSNQRYSQESGKIPHKKNNFIVEGIEPAKRLVPSSAKPSKRKHLRNLECKTVSIITIPSQDKENKYFSLGPAKGNTVENKNKMKRLQLYYQYSMDSNKCSGTTFSEEKSVVSESVKIFSDFSDLNGKAYGESNVLRLSNKQPYECYLDPNPKNCRRKNKRGQKVEYFDLLESNLDSCPNEGGDMAAKQEKTKKNKCVTSEINLHNENDRQVTDKLPREQRNEEIEKKSVKLQEETAVFNVDILRSAIQAHKDIGKQLDGCQNPNNQILKYLENMYCLLVSTLPQNHLIHEKIDASGDQNDSCCNKRNVVDNEIIEKPLEVIENDEVTKQLEKRTVDTSYHELLTDEVPKVDQITPYQGNCSKVSEHKPAVKTIDQVTSYHDIYKEISKNVDDYLNNKQMVDQAARHLDLVDKAAGKDFKSMEIMAVLDAVNYAISKSVTAMAKDLEDLGKKKQLELEATKEEIIKIFDTATHNIDVQTGKETAESCDNYVSPKLIRSTQKFSNVTYENTFTDTDDIKNKARKNSNKLKDDSAHNKNKPASEVVKDKLLSSCKEKSKEVNKNKWVPPKLENNIEVTEVKIRQKNPNKSKCVERTSSISKIPRKIKPKNEFLFKKSQSEVSLRQLPTGKLKGRISSLICLHRYMNDVNFPDSSASCMDNFYLGRSVNNEQPLSSRLFLTKEYRSPQMSSYQRRKIYDEVIRNKMKKKTVMQDKKIGQVFEVRYITLDKDFKTPETLKKISESKIEESEHKSLHDFNEETTDLVEKKNCLSTLVQNNLTPDKKSTLVELLSKILTSTEFSKVKPKLKKKCTCDNFINIIKELSSCSKDPESAAKMNHPTISDDSTLLPNSKTYTVSKKSVTAEQRSGLTIEHSDSSSDFLYNDDQDEDESQPKQTANPILGFAFKSDANIKKTEVGSFVESQNSEESGYISSGRSKYNLSLSSFFKNPVISELLKPQGEFCAEETRSLHEIESKSSQKVSSKSSSEEISEEYLVEEESSTATDGDVIEDIENYQEVSKSISSEESPLQFILPKSSIGMLGIRKSISEIDIQPKSSDDNIEESFSGTCPRRAQSETFLENKTHILNTVQYVNECGDTVYSRSMQLYTEIIENNCKEDIVILKRLLDTGVYLIATNFNTGCITLVIDKDTDESFYKRNISNNSTDIKKMAAQKFFENLLRVYERECIVGTLLFDDKEFMENELYSTVRGIKNYSSRNRFGKRMRTFLRKIFFNRSKIIDREAAATYTEKGLPLDECYQRHFQMLADYTIQHFSTLLETMPFSLDKNVEMNICGFFTLLKRIKNGQFVFLRVEEDVNIEGNIRNQTKQGFRNIYLTAYNEARKYHRKFTNHDMNLVGAFVCKYRIGLLTRIDLITSYLGRGFFETEVELKAAVVYVMKVLTSIIELEDFENHCKNTDVHVQK